MVNIVSVEEGYVITNKDGTLTAVAKLRVYQGADISVGFSIRGKDLKVYDVGWFTEGGNYTPWQSMYGDYQSGTIWEVRRNFKKLPSLPIELIVSAHTVDMFPTPRATGNFAVVPAILPKITGALPSKDNFFVGEEAAFSIKIENRGDGPITNAKIGLSLVSHGPLGLADNPKYYDVGLFTDGMGDFATFNLAAFGSTTIVRKIKIPNDLQARSFKVRVYDEDVTYVFDELGVELAFGVYPTADDVPSPPPVTPTPPPETPPPTTPPVEVSDELLEILKTGAQTYLNTSVYGQIVTAVTKVLKSDVESGNKYSRMLAAVNPINAAAMFGDFIGEEAMQTAMFPVSILIREKKWAAASRQLDYAKDVWQTAKTYRDTFGQLNVSSGEMFEANLQAVASSLIEYKELVKSYYNKELEVPDQFEALAREITDGDTINVIYQGHKIPVRLVGINTPESGEPYYGDAKRALFRFVWGQKVTIKADPANFEDNNGRLLAVIELAGLNINYAMVAQGWAFFYPLVPHKFVDPKVFGPADEFARYKKLGIWGLINRANLSAPGGAVPIKSARTAIKISSLPSHSTIFLDGEYTYKLTPETIDVQPGKHTVRVSSLGFEDTEVTIEVPDGSVVEQHFKLNKL